MNRTLNLAFWNQMYELYPSVMEYFNNWVNQYKDDHKWELLFHAGWYKGVATAWLPTGIPFSVTHKHKTPEFHELPDAMQLGIFFEWRNSFIQSNQEDEIDWTKSLIKTGLDTVYDNIKNGSYKRELIK